ncbi:MAG TPA: malate synthase A, partial [Stenomitos sp.]
IMQRRMRVLGTRDPEADTVLTRGAMEFVASLARRFEPARKALLERRSERQERLLTGELPTFPPETAHVRSGNWSVAPTPLDLWDRRVEITGPVDRKMMINGLNSGAKVFMADLEDSCSPTWTNLIQGQLNLMDTVRRTLRMEGPDGKEYVLGPETATLVVRPRGWHMTDHHVLFEGEPISASLLDFGLYFYHNAEELVNRGSGPYFYLPKLESHLEARLWNDVFVAAQEDLGLPRGTIRATVLIETLPAAFEMEEILFELKEHAAGLNAGRWDYIFSVIKKLGHRPDFILPDRGQVTMNVPFMAAYSDLLVKTCHKRGAHAIGGMSAFIPSRKDPRVNELALAKVQEDKLREALAGFDGTWVAHPDLVPVARAVFDRVLGPNPHQRTRLRTDLEVPPQALLSVAIPSGKITEAGLRLNLSVALQYLSAWLGGRGAVALHDLMEDVATAEICRAQIWQWLRHNVRLEDGRTVCSTLYRRLRDEEVAKLGDLPHLEAAVTLLDELVRSDRFVDFLTIPAYQVLGH